MNLKAFIKKYRWTMVCWILLLTIILFYAPKQHGYYLAIDIATFKTGSFIPILVGIGAIISIAFFLVFIFKKMPISLALIGLMFVSLLTTIYMFLLQDALLAGLLFLNRTIRRENFQKTYIINYKPGQERSADGLIPHDIDSKQVSNDHRLKEKLNNPGLNKIDIVHLTLYKGLFGVAFPGKYPKSFN